MFTNMKKILSLTQKQIDQIVNYDLAITTYDEYPFNKPSMTLVDYKPPYDWACDKVLGSVFALVNIYIHDCKPAEKDWARALNLKSTQQYIKWFREGHYPPPIFVVQHQDGNFISCNRRRWLAAREAGLNYIPAWLSPSNQDGTPKWEHRRCSFDYSVQCLRRRNGEGCIDCLEFEERKR